MDNFARAGSELNRVPLKTAGVEVFHGDARLAEDVDSMPTSDWVIDAAAQPSVLGGLGGGTESRRLLSYNLVSTINVLEYCRRHKAGLILLSTSRVYNIGQLASLSVTSGEHAFAPDLSASLPAGLTARGISEEFSTDPPVSLYGVTKLASERIALEYGEAFGFPVWINRCGVLAGAGQFGRPDQGILAFWVHSFRERRPLRYIGFGGRGLQVRDFLHPADLVPLIVRQFEDSATNGHRAFNLGGGSGNALSLRQITDWCEQRFGAQPVHSSETPRPYDLPWVVLDHGRATQRWGWAPIKPVAGILEEIAQHAEAHPDWLKSSQ